MWTQAHFFDKGRLNPYAFLRFIAREGMGNIWKIFGVMIK